MSSVAFDPRLRHGVFENSMSHPVYLSARLPALVAVLLLAGCASREPVLAPQLPAGATGLELTQTPFFPQEQYQCGPAALATVLTVSGVAITPQKLVPRVYIPAREGSLQTELVAASRSYGRLPYRIDPSLEGLLAELRAGRPVLVLQNLGLDSYPLWHYAVVVGFDPADDQVVLRSGRTEREILSAARFLDTWQRAGAWGLVILRPGELPARPDAEAYLTDAAALEAVQQTEVARQAYAAAARRWPDNPIALFGLANTRYAEGELQQAEAAYRELIRRHPDYAAAYNNLAQTLADRGCYAAALDTVERGLALEAAGLGDTLERTRATIAAHRQNDMRPGADCPPD